MKRGLILVNAYTANPHELNQSVRLKEELEKAGCKADIMRNDFFAANIESSGEIRLNVKGYDFCVYSDKDKYISQMLERANIRLFNSHFSVRACDDKMTTYILLSNGGIKMPKTFSGLLCYSPAEPIKGVALDRLERELGYPMIAKTCYGSLGEGVFKIDGRAELEEIAAKLKCAPHLYQEFIASSKGRDMRVIVIGGKVIAAMLRKNDGDFRSNLELGGTATAITPPKEVEKLCVKAAKILKLDYCGVDVLFGEDGYYVCEVNSNAFFGGIEKVTGVNVAAAYAEHILKCI